MTVCEITGREKVEGSDGIERVPCDGCGSADESALEKPAGTDLFLCAECYDRYESTTMIWNVPLVPFVAGISLVAAGVIGAIAVDPSGVVIALLGLAGLGYQRDVTKHGVRRVDDRSENGGNTD